MRGTGSAVDFAAVFLMYRLAMLAIGAVSWLWLALPGKNAGHR